MSILKTRLYKPIVKDNYIFREQIVSFLEKNKTKPLTLVVAAAGYGKSVTISQWLDHKGSKYGWISLGADCNDLGVFLDYLISCIQITYPESLKNFQDFSNVIELPPVKVISEFFVNDLTELEEEYVLVLDDYHLINNSQIHSLINEVLRYPAQKLRLFILSRKDPSLTLSTLKAYDHVNEIRMSELKFSESELIELSEKISSQPIKHEIAENLLLATEGWIIALKLALQSISQGRDVEAILSDIASDKQTLTQFLMDEIIHPQSQDIRDCLYRASILSRFCEGLLQAVCAKEEVEENMSASTDPCFFAEITGKTLFIIPLDADNTWFRYHHLLSEIMHKQLEKNYRPDQISALHIKACRWFESNGYPDEAIQHALKANDIEFANQIIENQLHDLFDNEKLPLMDRWLKMFPVEKMDNYIATNLIRAFLFDTNHEYVSMEEVLNKAYKILKELSPENQMHNLMWGYYYSLQSILFYKTERIQESLLSTTQALELLDSDHSLLKDAAILYHAFALIAFGKWSEADKKVMHYRASVNSNDQLGLARSSIVVSYVSFLSGNLPRIYSVLYPIIDFYIGKSYNSTRSMAYYYLGFVNYQWNHLDEAIQLSDRIWDHRFSSMPRWVLNNLFIKVLVLHAKGDKAALYEGLEMAHRYVDEMGLTFFDQFLACIEVEIALHENDLDRVEQYRYKADYDNQIPYCFYFVPQLTRVKLKIKEGGAENLRKAQTELSDITEYLRTTYNKNLLIQALTLQAFLLKLLGNIPGALTCLSEAINMAKPGGFIRVFVDMGEEIRDLIVLHKNKNADDLYINKILEAFPHKYNVRIDEANPETIIIKNSSSLNEEHLSAKEIEILRLVATGLQNKEIAEKLFLSYNSIKKYIYDIYQKLEVSNRTSAVNKAKQLDLI